MLLLVFNYCNRLRDLVECFVASSVEAEHGSLFEKTELLTIVVIDVKFLLDPFHLFEVSDEVRVLSRLKKCMQLFFLNLELFFSHFPGFFGEESDIRTAGHVNFFLRLVVGCNFYALLDSTAGVDFSFKCGGEF